MGLCGSALGLAGAVTASLSATLSVPSEEYPDIQTALAASRDGDEVAVAPGIYRGPGNRDLEFYGTRVRLYSTGGAAETVIDCEGSLLDPHQGAVVDDGETLATTIEGFTFVGAFALGKGSDRKGGAILCSSASSLTVRDCVFVGNDAARGGAVYVTEGSRVDAFGCSFRGNRADLNGGAVSAENGDFVAVDCDFVGNVSEKNAAGIGALSGAEVVLLRCRMRAQDARDHGGALFVDRSSLRVEDCEFAGNSARLGAGLYAMREAEVESIGSTLAGNQAGELGGGLYLRDLARVDLERTILWGNCETTRENDAYVRGENARLAFLCSATRPEYLDGSAGVLEFEGAQVFTDPQFCEAQLCSDAPTDAGSYGIGSESPCTAERSPCGARIGAGAIRCGTTPRVVLSWGVLKARWSGAPAARTR